MENSIFRLIILKNRLISDSNMCHRSRSIWKPGLWITVLDWRAWLNRLLRNGRQLAILLPEYNTAIVTTADTQGYQGATRSSMMQSFAISCQSLKRKRHHGHQLTKKNLLWAIMSKLAIRPLNHNKSASEAWNNKFENVNDINTSFLTNFRPIMSSFGWTYVSKRLLTLQRHLIKT